MSSEAQPDYVAILSRVSKKEIREGFDALTLAERVIFCVDWLDFEVSLSGFDTYYHNSAGAYAVETVDALERIGATNLATVLRRANALFPHNTPPRSQDERWAVIEPLIENESPILDELKHQYLQHQAEAARLEQFIDRHYSELVNL